MLDWLRGMASGHRAATRAAERIVVEQNDAAYLQACAAAIDGSLSDEDRRHQARIARMVMAKHQLLLGVDTATRYCIVNDWRTRSTLPL